MNWFKTIFNVAKAAPKTATAIAGAVIITASAVPATQFLDIVDDKTAPMTAKFEGAVLKNYWDSIGGVETWCFGETQVGRLETGYTYEYCLALFTKRFREYSTRLYGCYTDEMKQYVSPAMHGAFVDVYYNTGKRCNSSMMIELRRGQPVAACDAILQYKRAGGKDCSVRANGCWGVWDRRVQLHAHCIKEAQQIKVKKQ